MTGWKRNIRVKQYRIEITDLAAVNTVEGNRQKINSLGVFPERNELDEDEELAQLGIRNDYYKNYKNVVVSYIWIIG